MMIKKNLVYFGSPIFSAQILESLINQKKSPYQVVAVITQPDQPAGRSHQITPSPVAMAALKYNLPTYKPEKLETANLAHLKIHKPDIFLVISYGNFIPQSWLDTPSIGAFNIHFSLLPKYRGALCISEAIRNQDSETGVTLMLVDNQLDHGPIITQNKIAIDTNDNNETLTAKLTQSSITLLHDWLPKICQREFPITPQIETDASYTPLSKIRTRQNAYLDWKQLELAMNGQDAARIHALIRSNNPEPGTWTKIKDVEIKLIKTTLQNSKLIVDLIQIPGKNPISWQQFSSRWN